MISMTPVLPGTTAQDVTGIIAILAMLGDDNKFKQRMDTLIKQVQEAQAAVDVAKAAEQMVAVKAAAVDARAASVEQAGTVVVQREAQANVMIAAAMQAKIDVDNTRVAVDVELQKARENSSAVAAERQRLSSEADQALKRGLAEVEAARVRSADMAAKRQTELDVAASAVQAREAAAQKREQALQQEADKLAAMRVDLEDRFNKLRAMIN